MLEFLNTDPSFKPNIEYVVCLECGSIILESRKDLHVKMHEEIKELQDKFKKEPDYNEG